MCGHISVRETRQPIAFVKPLPLITFPAHPHLTKRMLLRGVDRGFRAEEFRWARRAANPVVGPGTESSRTPRSASLLALAGGLAVLAQQGQGPGHALPLPSAEEARLILKLLDSL